MAEEGTVHWTFYGYQTPAGRKDVQEWFNGLLEDEKDEARDTLGYLQKLQPQLWKKPEFERLDHDISEIRFKVPAFNKIYRIYGSFWPEGRRYSYSLLLGKDKKVANDRRGKKEALGRLKKLRREEATIHEFEFEGRSNQEATARERGSPTVY